MNNDNYNNRPNQPERGNDERRNRPRQQEPGPNREYPSEPPRRQEHHPRQDDVRPYAGGAAGYGPPRYNNSGLPPTEGPRPDRYGNQFEPEDYPPVYDEFYDEEESERKKRIFIIITSVVVALAVLIGAFFIIRALLKNDSETELEKIERSREETSRSQERLDIHDLTDPSEQTDAAGARITRVITTNSKPRQTPPQIIPTLPTTTESFQQWEVVEETTVTTVTTVEPSVITDPVTEPATAAPTEAPTAAPTEAPTEAPTQPVTEPATEQPTEPSTEKPTEPSTEPSTEPPTQPTEPEQPVLVDADKGPITVGDLVILPVSGGDNYHAAEKISDISKSANGKNWMYKKDGKTYLVAGNNDPRELPEEQKVLKQNTVTDTGYFFMDSDTLKRADLTGENIEDAVPEGTDSWVVGDSSLRVLYMKDNTIAIADGAEEPVTLAEEVGNKARLIALLHHGRIGIWADDGKLYAAAGKDVTDSVEWDVGKKDVDIYVSKRYTLLYQKGSKTVVRLTHDGASDKKPTSIKLTTINLPDGIKDDAEIIDAHDRDVFLILSGGSLYRVKGNNEVTKDGTSVTQAGFMGNRYFMIADKKLKVIADINDSATYEERASNVKLASFNSDASYIYYVHEGNLMTYPELEETEVIAGNVARYLPVKDKGGVLVLKQDNQLVYVKDGKEVKDFGRVKPETIDANIDYIYGGNAFVGGKIMIIPEDKPTEITFEDLNP